jgi:hypothetical protein
MVLQAGCIAKNSVRQKKESARRENILRAIFAQHRQNIEKCYRKTIDNDLATAGTYNVVVSVDKDGKVRHIDINSNVPSTKAEQLHIHNCIKRIVREAVFPNSPKPYTQKIKLVLDDDKVFEKYFVNTRDSDKMVNRRDGMGLKFIVTPKNTTNTSVSSLLVKMKAQSKSRWFIIDHWMSAYVIKGCMRIAGIPGRIEFTDGFSISISSTLQHRVINCGTGDLEVIYFFVPPGPELCFSDGRSRKGVLRFFDKNSKNNKNNVNRNEQNGTLIYSYVNSVIASKWTVSDTRLPLARKVTINPNQRVIANSTDSKKYHYIIIVLHGVLSVKGDEYSTRRRITNGTAFYVPPEYTVHIMPKGRDGARIVVFFWPEAGGRAFPITGDILKFL